jgi:hypothetical protein
MTNVYLSYSGRKIYMTCPYKYKRIYMDRDSEVSDRKDALFGLIIGKIFEWFYELRFWNNADPVSVSLESIDRALCRVIEDEKVAIDDEFKHKLLSDLKYYVPFGVKVIKDNGLLSDNSRAEVKLDVFYQIDDLTIRLGGRADFIHMGSHIQILDGKGSKWRDKYADPEQLIWYATQFFLKHHVAPSKLGFIYWKFPNDPIEWIAYNDNSIRNSLKQTVDVVRKILKKEFDPSPSNDCKMCGFKCDEGKDFLESRKLLKKTQVTDSILDVEIV